MWNQRIPSDKAIASDRSRSAPRAVTVAASKAGLSLAALALALPAAAATDLRLSDLYAQRMTIQNSLREAAQQALEHVAFPHYLLVTIELAVTTGFVEQTTTDVQPPSEINIGTSQALKLPGLPAAALPRDASNPGVSIKVPSHERVTVRREAAPQIERIGVRLYVEESIPDAQLAQVEQATVAVTGLDKARGDTLETVKIPARAGFLLTRNPSVLVERSVLLLALVLLLGAALVAFAVLRLGRRWGSQDAAATENARVTVGPVVANDNGGDVRAAYGEARAEAGGKPQAFAALRDAPVEQIVEVVTLLPPRTIAIVLDQAALPGPVLARIMAALPEAHQLEVAMTLASRAVVPTSDIAAMEAGINTALTAAQSRLAVGGPSRVAAILTAAPPNLVRQLLSRLGQRDEALARELRQRVALFEDLSTLPVPIIRQIVTAAGPTQIAVALVGADKALRAAVLGAVSKRLKSILVAEEETMAEPTAADVEKARRTVEHVMRQVRPASEAAAS
ncbi:MAG: hypothetical protein HY903_13995 [Deltaproteobacteria bacterium]|nr:hypothetical protein [Deltaproteobacteria bacterium]